MEMAARRRIAAQPSARLVSRSSDSADSPMPCWAMSRQASGVVKARSPARISVSSPVRRYRCSGSNGSIREATTSRSPGVACFST